MPFHQAKRTEYIIYYFALVHRDLVPITVVNTQQDEIQWMEQRLKQAKRKLKAATNTGKCQPQNANVTYSLLAFSSENERDDDNEYESEEPDDNGHGHFPAPVSTYHRPLALFKC